MTPTELANILREFSTRSAAVVEVTRPLSQQLEEIACGAKKLADSLNALETGRLPSWRAAQIKRQALRFFHQLDQFVEQMSQMGEVEQRFSDWQLSLDRLHEVLKRAATSGVGG